MSRKQRTAKARQDVPLTPAMTYALMVGRWADVRLHGWVKLAQAGMHGEPTPDTVWDAHGDELTAEAQSYGFEPHRLTGRCPNGPAFDRWQREFLDRHRY